MSIEAFTLRIPWAPKFSGWTGMTIVSDATSAAQVHR